MLSQALLEAVLKEGAPDLTRLYPWIFPPLDAETILFMTGAVAVTASGGTAEEDILLSMVNAGTGVCPRCYAGLLTHLGTDTDADPATMIFDILINTNIRLRQTTPYGSPLTPAELGGRGIRFGSGDRLRVRFTNNDTIARQASLTVGGYLYPTALGPARIIP